MGPADRITFHGHEYKAPFEVTRVFEDMGDDELRSYAAIIVPSAIVSDRLRYTEDVNKLAAGDGVPRAGLRREGHRQGHHLPRHVAGCAGAGAGPGPAAWCAHNNLHGDVSNMGAVYTDEDVVIDGDLVTGRTGGHCHLFARAIIDMIAAKDGAARSGTGAG